MLVVRALDSRCLSQNHPWSVIDISVTNAQLAGVLAGFILLALTTLLTIKRSKKSYFRFGVKHAVVLLGLGVIVLGVDAYLFGSVAATRPSGELGWPDQVARPICQRAWLGFLPAIGLLTLGAELLVAGLAWMIVGHGQPTERFRLARSSSQAFMFVSTGTLAFSLSTSLVFINALQTDFGFGGGVGLTCLNVSAWILAIAFFAAVMWSLQCARRKIQKETRQVKPDRLASVWSEIDDYDPNDTIQRKLDKAYFCIVICLFCAVALTWILTTYPSFFNGTSMRWFGAVAGLVTCLGLPGITFVMLARALPGMNQEPQLSALPSPPISRVNQVPGALARLVVISFAVIIVAHRYFTDRLH